MDYAGGGSRRPTLQWRVLLALLVVLMTLSKITASPLHYTGKYEPFPSNNEVITHWIPFSNVDDRDTRAAPVFSPAKSKKKSQPMKATKGQNLSKQPVPVEDRAFGDEASMHASLLGRR